MTRLRVHPHAGYEIEEAAAWYESRAPGLGDEFLAQVRVAMSSIRAFPQTGPMFDPEFGMRRFLVHRFPFGVLYKDNPSEVYVVAIMHLKRRPGYWRDRLIG